MKTKILALSCLVWAIAAISMGRPAQASFNVAILMEDVPDVAEVTKILVTGKISDINPYGNSCGLFGKMQRMVVPGVGRVEALADQEHVPGLKEAVFVQDCGDGYALFVISE